MKRNVVFAAIFLLASCATTKIQSNGSPLQKPLCEARTQSSSVSVLWSPNWRPDQKEPQLREAAALRGIEQYFKAQSCIQTLAIHRITLPEQHAQISDGTILTMAREAGDRPDKIILLIVRELGPTLKIGMPTLIEGGTEVILETRVTDQKSGTSLANIRTQWQKSGPFYIKGVETLDADIQTVLGTIFSSSVERP